LRGGKTGNTPLSATEAIILGAGVSIILTASALIAKKERDQEKESKSH